MDFLTFLVYFLVSMSIFKVSGIAISLSVRKYLQYKFTKDIKSGKIKLVTMDELYADQLANGTNEDDGGTTWN